MLILAGVSLNALVGDNGIITNAMDANIKSGIAILEEYFQELYVQGYDEFDSNYPISGIRSKYPTYFYSPHLDDNIGNNDYVVYTMVDENGVEQSYDLYLIKKIGLPQEVRENLIGGDANGGGYINYSTLNDVYGLTSDLKVFYCPKGIDSLMSVSIINFDKSDPNRVIFSKGTSFANLISNDNEDITINDIKKVKDIEITASSGVTSLSELYNFSSLTTLKLVNVTLSSLSGLENATKINKIWIQDCTIGDYSQICLIDTNIKTMYLYLTLEFENAQNEVDKFLDELTGIQKGNFTDLEYFGIFGDTSYIDTNNMNYFNEGRRNNVNNISKMSKFTSVTKGKIKYLYLNNLGIDSLECLEDYNSVYILNVSATKITTFKGIENMTGISRVYAKYCYSLGANEVYNSTDVSNNYGKNTTNDALAYIPLNTTYAVQVEITDGSKIKFVSYINSWKEGSKLSLGSTMIGEKDLELCLGKLRSGLLSVDSKYSSYLNTASRMDLANSDLTNVQLEAKLDGGYDVLTKLRIDGNTLLTDDVAEGETSLSGILNRCTKMQALSMVGITGINNINFVQYMPALVELNIKNCSNIIDISILETLTLSGKLTLKTLCMNTYNTKEVNGKQVPDWSKSNDLTTIQTVISNFYYNGSSFVWGGSFLGSTDASRLITTTNVFARLADCTEITNLYFYREVPTGDLDLSKCTKLKNIYMYSSRQSTKKWKLPRSVETIECGGTVLTPTFEIPEYTLELGYSKLESLTIASLGVGQTILNDYFSEISKSPNFKTLTLNLREYPDSSIDFTQLDFGGLTLPTFQTLTLKKFNFEIPAKKIIGINSGMSSLTKFEIYDYANLTEIDGLENLVNLTELKVQQCKLNSIKNIDNLSELQILNLYENSISEIYYIKDLSKLEELHLQNNALYDYGSVKVLNENNEEVTVTYKTLDILYDLNYNTGKGNSLKGLWISGNTGITDVTKLLGTSWPKGKDGF